MFFRQKSSLGTFAIRYDSTVRLLITIIFSALFLSVSSSAQWEIEDAHTTANLRGIDNVGGGIAWASGSNGTVLRTEDGGYRWQLCAIPPGAEKLDFRGIQAFDAKTAIVMSSGKGDLSRLYKTTDGCQTWKLVFTNPDKDGFWDAFQLVTPKTIWILGDPVPYHRPVPNPQFAIYISEGGKNFVRFQSPALEAEPSKAGAFAASNSSLRVSSPPGWCWFGTGGSNGPQIFYGNFYSDMVTPYGSGITQLNWNSATVTMAVGRTAGIFSIAFRETETGDHRYWALPARLAAVGGDYTKPNDTAGNAAYSLDGGKTWQVATTLPHGYRSAVAWDAQDKLWITVGPNGTDISRDDGRNWTALKPAKNEPTDADKDWNALSLPFVVGPNGRIGKLRPSALQAGK
ncbi:MAG TPA: hypothetical protein VFE38_12540 [Edaphobacter sp.]|nr:hypothetical protein [Edaphobacter sp.]